MRSVREAKWSNENNKKEGEGGFIEIGVREAKTKYWH